MPPPSPTYAPGYLLYCGLRYIKLCWDGAILLLAFFLIENIKAPTLWRMPSMFSVPLNTAKDFNERNKDETTRD